MLVAFFVVGCGNSGSGGNDEDGSEIANSIENVVDEVDSNESEGDDDEGNSSSIIAGSSLGETDFGKLLISGSLEIAGIEAVADEETVGEILAVHFINRSNDDIQVLLPCGLIFLPDDSDNQPLMLVQPLEVSLAAGEEVTLEPFVVCADLGTAAPGLGSGYTIGYMEDEKMLSFAECICGEDVDTTIGSLDAFGIQFATWSISIDGDISNLIDSSGDSAMAVMMGDMTIDEFNSYFSGILDTFGNEWLNRCDIVIEE